MPSGKILSILGLILVIFPFPNFHPLFSLVPGYRIGFLAAVAPTWMCDISNDTPPPRCQIMQPANITFQGTLVKTAPTSSPILPASPFRHSTPRPSPRSSCRLNGARHERPTGRATKSTTERNGTERIARGTNIDKTDGQPDGKRKRYSSRTKRRGKRKQKKRPVPRVERRGEKTKRLTTDDIELGDDRVVLNPIVGNVLRVNLTIALTAVHECVIVERGDLTVGLSDCHDTVADR